VADGLPRGSAVIYRAFGAPDAATVALRLRTIARRRRLLLLIGADEGLAAQAGADGLHLPERLLGALPTIRRRRPGWILTVAVHSAGSLMRAERLGADAVLLSTAFPSASPSAGAPWGAVRLAQLVRSVRTPVLALGGVNGLTAARAVGSGVAGLAAVEAWTT
jgi:thiamine-phosphate pyrophosphorylase